MEALIGSLNQSKNENSIKLKKRRKTQELKKMEKDSRVFL
jgi:hypothetical protein